MTNPETFSLLAQETGGTTPIVLVSEKGLNDLIKKEPEHVKEWIRQNRFSGKEGDLLAIPGQTGKIKAYYAGLPMKKDLYTLAGLSSRLPEGNYKIRNMKEHFSKEEAYQATLGWALHNYNFDKFKTNKNTRTVNLVISGQIDQKALLSEASAVYMVRDLINRPANDLGTKELTKAARNLAGEFNCAAKVTKGAALLKNDYPLIHTVGRASDQEPAFVDFTWGDDRHPKISLIGKGIVFDSGGLDLKPGASMYGMEKDMGGAANVLGLAKMIMEANLPVRLRVLIPIAENAVSANAYRPGDILTSRKNAEGKAVTIENGNTDAEGRLVLADAIIEASKEKPDLLIDFATLTGAQRIAHGMEIGAILGTDKEMLRELEDISEQTDDYLAALPLHQRYKKDLSSKKADIKSTGGKAGSITAALFLHHFVNATQWVHLDISGHNPTSSPVRPAGGEAMGMRTMFRYLDKRFR